MNTIYNMMLLGSNHSPSMHMLQGRKRFPKMDIIIFIQYEILFSPYLDYAMPTCLQERLKLSQSYPPCLADA